MSKLIEGAKPGEPIVTDVTMDAQVANAMTRKVNRLKDDTIDLAIRCQEARQWLEWNTENVKESWIAWLKLSEKILTEIRQARMAIGLESKQLLSECGDVRKFFLSDDHEKELTKLREFIELAERLRSLKNDGTLDKQYGKKAESKEGKWLYCLPNSEASVKILNTTKALAS